MVLKVSSFHCFSSQLEKNPVFKNKQKTNVSKEGYKACHFHIIAH